MIGLCHGLVSAMAWPVSYVWCAPMVWSPPRGSSDPLIGFFAVEYLLSVMRSREVAGLIPYKYMMAAVHKLPPLWMWPLFATLFAGLSPWSGKLQSGTTTVTERSCCCDPNLPCNVPINTPCTHGEWLRFTGTPEERSTRNPSVQNPVKRKSR